MSWVEETYRDEVRFGLRVGRRVVKHRSALQTIELVETPAFGRVLLLDGVFMTSEADEFLYHEMLVHPVLMTAPRVERVLIVGGGDGGVAREVLRHPGVREVVIVEIDGDVVSICREHLPGLGAWEDPRLEVVVEDGVAYVAAAAVGGFDVVLLNGTDPVGPGEALFGVPFYREVRRVLGKDGVFGLQSASPFGMREVYARVQEGLRGVFGVVRPYFGPAPLYACGVWSWTWASGGGDPLAVEAGRAAAVAGECRYWTPEVHRAAFAMPPAFRV